MIELHEDSLIFSFPELEDLFRARVRDWIDDRLSKANAKTLALFPEDREQAYLLFSSYKAGVKARAVFQRTMRSPDNGKSHGLLMDCGRFPLRHIEDYDRATREWQKTGGVMMPIHLTEATWIEFNSEYPIALRVAAGGICCVTGEPWQPGLSTPQNYLCLPSQKWLDGFRIDENTVRQFVAAESGKGLTVESQIKGHDEWNGLQLQAYPMNLDEAWRCVQSHLSDNWDRILNPHAGQSFGFQAKQRAPSEAAMGAGGLIDQRIVRDLFSLGAWNQQYTSRCYVRLCLAKDWTIITEEPQPPPPQKALDYLRLGGPWLQYNSPFTPLTDVTKLKGIKSVNTLLIDKTGTGIPNNETLSQENIFRITDGKRKVREF